MSEPRTRSAAEVADHASAVQEEVAIAQGHGYIRPTDNPDPTGIHPSLPGFRRLSHGSANLRAHGETVRWDTFESACDHIRFLEHAVERLASQVEDLAAVVAEETVESLEILEPDSLDAQGHLLAAVQHIAAVPDFIIVRRADVRYVIDALIDYTDVEGEDPITRLTNAVEDEGNL